MFVVVTWDGLVVHAQKVIILFVTQYNVSEKNILFFFLRCDNFFYWLLATSVAII